MPEALAAPRVAEALAGASARLAAAGCDSPRLDAELLLGEVLEVDRARLVLESRRALGPGELTRFERLVARRQGREPVPYILGRRWFRALELTVDPRVLIPLPETELLVDAALELPSGASVVDVGTGSGAVALALASERPDLRVTGADCSEDALALARANAARLGLPVSFIAADLLPPSLAPDAVLANLPYVSDRTELPPEVARFEPPGALFGGPDGLGVIRRLVAALPASVRFVALEVGDGQASAVAGLLAGYEVVERLRDLAGIERVVVGHGGKGTL